MKSLNMYSVFVDLMFSGNEFHMCAKLRSYEIKKRKMMSHFELLTQKSLQKFFF